MQARARNPASLASQANGATMRAAPLAIWGHRLAPAAIAAAAAADARLSHPSRACQDANAAYALALAALIRQPGDAAAALAAAEGWAAEFGCSDVQSWLAAARDDALMAAYRAGAQQGWVRHGLQLAFYHLRRRSGYEPGLRHVLLAGGDTGEGLAPVQGWGGSCGGGGPACRLAPARQPLRQHCPGSHPSPPLPPCNRHECSHRGWHAGSAARRERHPRRHAGSSAGFGQRHGRPQAPRGAVGAAVGAAGSAAVC